MPSMGGSATLISAPHLGDLLDVDMTGKTDQCVPSYQQAAGKYEPLPNVVGDGHTPGGLKIGGNISVGTPSDTDPSMSQLNGHLFITSTPGDFLDGDNTLTLTQTGELTADGADSPTLSVVSNYVRGAFTPSGPVVRISVSDAGLGPIGASQVVLVLHVTDHLPITFNAAGGIGLFGIVPPAAQPGINGALSTVADAAAQAVLQGVVNALAGCGVAVDNTT